MHRLCYISTARRPIDTAMCEDILAASRRNNVRDGISGMLVAGRNRFLQALEGDEAVVRRTYERIVEDPRHFAGVVLDERHVAARQFQDWSMAFQRSDEGMGNGSDKEIAARLIARIADFNLRAQFEGFLTLQWDSRAA